MASPEADPVLRGRLAPYHTAIPKGADQNICRAIVLDAKGQLCGELADFTQLAGSLKGQLKTAVPAMAILPTPTESEVNAVWDQKARALMAKAGQPVEKIPGTAETINDTDIPAMTDITKAKLLGLLVGVTDMFHKHDIPYVLACGTELGNARNHDLIKWDDDMDIVVPMEHLGRMLARRDDFLEQGILITPRYHGVKFSFLDDKQREKDGTPYPFVDIFAVEKNCQGEWEFEDVAGCKQKFPLEQLPADVFDRSQRTSFGPEHLGIKVNTIDPTTSLLYLNRVYGSDSGWRRESNILNKAYTHTYDHDTGVSKEPHPLNVTDFEPGKTPDALWPLQPRYLEKPLAEHYKYVPELMTHLSNHEGNWRVDQHVKESWPAWVAGLPVANKGK